MLQYTPYPNTGGKTGYRYIRQVIFKSLGAYNGQTKVVFKKWCVKVKQGIFARENMCTDNQDNFNYNINGYILLEFILLY